MSTPPSKARLPLVSSPADHPAGRPHFTQRQDTIPPNVLATWVQASADQQRERTEDRALDSYPPGAPEFPDAPVSRAPEPDPVPPSIQPRRERQRAWWIAVGVILSVGLVWVATSTRNSVIDAPHTVPQAAAARIAPATPAPPASHSDGVATFEGAQPSERAEPRVTQADASNAVGSAAPDARPSQQPLAGPRPRRPAASAANLRRLTSSPAVPSGSSPSRSEPPIAPTRAGSDKTESNRTLVPRERSWIRVEQ